MEQFLKELDSYLRASADKLKQDLQGIRSGRPSTELLENISVNVYEQNLKIRELGSLSVKPPREIAVTVWDQSIVNNVAKAIENAKIGLTPAIDGNTIHCNLPPLTEERRKELSKLIGKMAEETRIKIRTHRDETIKKIKASEADEDQVFKSKERIQKLIDTVNGDVETMVESKLKELEE